MTYLKYLLCFIFIISIIVSIWIFIQKSLQEKYMPETYIYKKIDKKILTYNIQKFPWSMKSFKDNEIYKLIKQHSIILLQECFDETYDLLESCFPEYYICRGTLKGFNVMNSGLVILSKFPIIDIEFYQYKNYNPFSFEIFSEKGFLSALINIENDKNIRVINTHLQSSDFQRYDKNAILQLRELNEYLNHLHDLDEKYIVGGDFNVDITDIVNISNTHLNKNLSYPKDPTIFINLLTSQTSNEYKKDYEPLIFDYFISELDMDTPKVIKCNYSDHNPVSTFFYLH